MDADLRRLSYEATSVPVAERGPIAAFQFHMLDEAGSEATLELLDRLDLIALIGQSDETEEKIFCGACYLGPTSLPGTAVLALYWTRPGIPDRAHKELLGALDDWLVKHDLDRALGFASKNPKGWSRTGRFEIERCLS